MQIKLLIIKGLCSVPKALFDKHLVVLQFLLNFKY